MKRELPRLPAAETPPHRFRRPQTLDPVEELAEIEIDLERAAGCIAEIRDLRLNADILDAVAGYEQVGDRNVFLWNWVRRGVEITCLSSVDEAYWDHVCDTKTLGVMFDVLLDDIADETDDVEFLERLIDIIHGREADLSDLSDERRAYYEFSSSVWKKIWARLESYPRFAEFQDILIFDYRQLMNSMRYSILMRRHPSIINLPEHDSFLPHNMHMCISGTIDLMVSSGFNKDELGRLRTALSFAQYMGRIGNLITTWEREIPERDFSSGVFAMALSLGVLTPRDLVEGEPRDIAARVREAQIERRFIVRWKRLRKKLMALKNSVRTVNLGKLQEGLETLIQLHLGSRGLK